jgi:hypothetical protein
MIDAIRHDLVVAMQLPAAASGAPSQREYAADLLFRAGDKQRGRQKQHHEASRQGDLLYAPCGAVPFWLMVALQAGKISNCHGTTFRHCLPACSGFLDLRTSPLVSGLGSLEQGTYRMPKLAPEAMASLCRAWLSLERGYYVHVCRQRGFATPDHKTPPTSQWKLLSGRAARVGPLPR